MQIRESQTATFEEHANRAFEDELVAHLNGFAPELCRILGEQGLRVYIRRGLQQAGSHEFTYRGPARFFLELMFSFGTSFDKDPQLPWARAGCRSSDEDQMTRATRLYELMEEYLHDVAGPDNEYAMQALRRIQSLANPSPPKPESVQALKHYLREVYPQKYDYVGENVIAILINNAVGFAREHQLTPNSVSLLTGLMFGFGAGVLKDPLYGWIRRTIDDPLIETREGKIERLVDKVRVYISAMLARPMTPSNA